MKITVFAKPRASENKIEQLGTNEFKVFVTAPPVKGLANQKIIEVLADHFNVSKSQIALTNGSLSHIKTFNITEN